MTIDAARAWIVSRCAVGEWADLGHLPESQRAVPAIFIRNLLLGLNQPVSDHAAVATRFVAYSPFASTVAAPFFVAAPGVRIRGARIQGVLDLTDCQGDGGQGLPGLALENCILEGGSSTEPGIDLSRARLAALSLSGSRFSYLRAINCVVDGGVTVRYVRPTGTWVPQTFPIDDPAWRGRPLGQDLVPTEGDWTEGRLAQSAPWPARADEHCRLDFEGLRAGGAFDICHSRLRSPDKSWYALDLARATIDGPVYLSDLAAEGGVSLNTARISGQVEASGARFVAGHDDALSAENVIVAHDMLLREGFLAHGNIWLLGAHVGGNLTIVDASVDGGTGRAISADRLVVEGTIQLGRNFRGVGCVRLLAARIGGNLEIAINCVIDCVDEEALNVENATIGCDMLVRDNVQLGSTLRLMGASIVGDLELREARIEASGGFAIVARALTVESRLTLDSNRLDGAVILVDATCGTLADEMSGYAGARRLYLDGFRYGRVEVTDGCWRDRVRWLAWQFAPVDADKAVKRSGRLPRPASLDDYHPQPYLQLAKALSAQGHDGDARRVLSLRRDIERVVAARNHVKPFLWLFAVLFDYGLSAGRALATLVVWLIAGAILVAVADARGAMVVDVQSVAAVGQAARAEAAPAPMACGDQINPPIYAVDLFIPLIDLRQEAKCEVGAAPGSRLWPGLDLGVPKTRWIWRNVLAEVELWRWAKALYGLCGWMLTSLAILTFSGVLRRQAEQT